MLFCINDEDRELISGKDLVKSLFYNRRKSIFKRYNYQDLKNFSSTFLYLYFDHSIDRIDEIFCPITHNSNLLYVGQTINHPYIRFSQHRLNDPWCSDVSNIYACIVPSEFADLCEYYLINRLNPVYNKKIKSMDSFIFNKNPQQQITTRETLEIMSLLEENVIEPLLSNDPFMDALLLTKIEDGCSNYSFYNVLSENLAL